jgi:hypothetical protein
MRGPLGHDWMCCWQVYGSLQLLGCCWQVGRCGGRAASCPAMWCCLLYCWCCAVCFAVCILLCYAAP